jgi:pyruvate kinase|tara:strand:- start:1585 stop:3774 length:2190 start_codon:yes stop_codon:yes gene_type:complete
MGKKLIIATLGPSSLNKEVVKKMDILGVDLFRINLSHVKINEFENTVKMVKKWTDKPVCPDTEGAQLRTESIKNNRMLLKIGSKILFSESTDKYETQSVPLNIPNPKQILLVGDILRIDFNSVIVQLIDFNSDGIIARVIKGGTIGSNKGIGVDREINFPRFTEKDIAAFKISKKLGLDTFFLSFCSKGEDVSALRKLFDYPIKIISKIETKKALYNLNSICEESDGILIDRGDLSKDVFLIRIAFAQSYILDNANNLNVPAYVATNLIESMVENLEPTRAEINDIVQSLENGASGLVLAAESAIGKYPTECVRLISNLIKEVDKKPGQIGLEYLVKPSTGNIISPHGGQLVQQVIPFEKIMINNLPSITVNKRVESDIIQISNGTYSPLDRFMDKEELDSVLDKNELLDETVWSMPILFQLNEKQKKDLKIYERLALKSMQTGQVFAIINVEKIEELKDINKIAKQWFTTDDSNHPGVKQFLNSGRFILSGKPFLIEKYKPISISNYELTPTQTRNLFSLFGWSNIIGYHTRNVPHRGHEYIQRKALEDTLADGIFISPVTGIKKKGDFTATAIINCFEKLIEEGFYDPFGVLIGSFNTYSRYCGPREAIFTAICRKNYGCNYFIVGRDHTGYGDYYASDASRIIFDSLDIGMKILAYEKVNFYAKKNIITNIIRDIDYDPDVYEISGSRVRDLILQGREIPDYLLNPIISEQIYKMLSNRKESVFEN